MGLCFAPGCDHTNKSGCKMFNFPKDVKLKEKWEQLVRRGDRKANKFSLICSCHFKDGNKDNLPSIFKHNIGKRFTYPSPERKKRRNILKLSDEILNHALLVVAREIEVNDIVEQIYKSELQI